MASHPHSNAAALRALKATLQRSVLEVNHLRITSYLQDLNRITGMNYSFETLPTRHCLKLKSLIETYTNIDTMLQFSGATWEDIRPLLVQYSKDPRARSKDLIRLKLSDWLRLEDEITQIYCPF